MTMEAIKVKDADLYVPGEFCCAKCGFALSQFALSASTGAISDRDDPGEKCPNDGSPLWRVTWKQRAQEHYERAIAEMKRADEAEQKLAALSAIEPVEATAEPVGILTVAGDDAVVIWYDGPDLPVGTQLYASPPSPGGRR